MHSGQEGGAGRNKFSLPGQGTCGCAQAEHMLVVCCFVLVAGQGERQPGIGMLVLEGDE